MQQINQTHMKKIHLRPVFTLFLFLFLVLLLFFLSLFLLAELQSEHFCKNDYSFNLYSNIFKLLLSYTMIVGVVFRQVPVKLETILDHQPTGGLQLLVTEFPQSHSENQISFQVEVVINPKTTHEPFC
jgi:hypothetical protein